MHNCPKYGLVSAPGNGNGQCCAKSYAVNYCSAANVSIGRLAKNSGAQNVK